MIARPSAARIGPLARSRAPVARVEQQRGSGEIQAEASYRRGPRRGSCRPADSSRCRRELQPRIHPDLDRRLRHCRGAGLPCERRNRDRDRGSTCWRGWDGCPGYRRAEPLLPCRYRNPPLDPLRLPGEQAASCTERVRQAASSPPGGRCAGQGVSCSLRPRLPGDNRCHYRMWK